MKRTILLLITLIGMTNVFAQPGCFIHKVYDQEPIVVWGGSSFTIDITGDDIKEIRYENHTIYGDVPYTINGWQCCFYRSEPWPGHNVFTDLDISFDDNSLPWGKYFTGDYIEIYPNPWGYYPDSAVICQKVALRFQQDDDYYYGWYYAKFIEGFTMTQWVIPIESCYCTIPNYPLRFGQTDFTLDVEENSPNAFASAFPNPTKGLFTIHGENLSRAEVYNTLGQQVASANGEGNNLQINISHLTPGLYFVNVTDDKKRNCMLKLMRQ